MALPRSISGTTSAPGFCGPIRASNGDHYLVLVDSTNDYQLEMWKADNGDNTWTQQDTGQTWTSGQEKDGYVAARLSGTTIYVVTVGISSELVQYHRFSTISDLWLETETELINSSAPWTTQGVGIEIESPSDITVLMNGVPERIHGTDYNRVVYRQWNGTSWGSEVQVDDGGQNDYAANVSVMGASNKRHFIYKDSTADDLEHKSLTSGGTLSSVNTIATISTNMWHGFIYYDASGTERVIAVHEEASATDLVSQTRNNDSGSFSRSVITTDDVEEATIVSRDSNDTAYAVWVDGNNIKYKSSVNSAAWGSETTIYTGTTPTNLACNIYTIDNGDVVIGFVFIESSTVKYDEYVIEAAGSTISMSATMTAATSTPTPDLAVLREMAATATAASNTIDTPSLSILREMVAASTASSATPDNITLTLIIQFLATITAATGTPDTPRLAILREMMATSTAASVTPDTPILAVLRELSATATANSNSNDAVSLAVLREMIAVATAASNTPDNAALLIVIQMAAVLTANSATPDSVTLAILREMTVVVTANSNTPNTVALSVLHEMTAILTAASNTPDTAELSIAGFITLAAVITASTATPDNVGLSLLYELAATITAATNTPDTAILSVLREIAATATANSNTPDTAALSILKQMAATITAVTNTPDNIELLIGNLLSLAATITAASATPDNVQLSILREMTAAITAGSAAPDDVSLAVSRTMATVMTANTATPDTVNLVTALIQGLVSVIFSSRQPGATMNSRQPTATMTSRQPAADMTGRGE